MNRIRNILSFLLIAGVACVHAAQPMVIINGGSQASGCDVSADPGAPIFQLDATGNVLVNGTVTGTGCGGSSGGGTNTPTFGLNPAPAGVLINGGSSTVAGTTTTVPLTYRAAYASSCTVGTPTTTGTCPAITANANCTGSGTPLSCSPANGTVSVPSVASMGTNTSCTYTATANCGGVTSSGSLVVTSTPVTGGGDLPPECANVRTMHNSAGAAWSRITNTTTVMYGDNVVTNGIDPKDYVAVWNYTGTGGVPWPGNLGLQTRVYTMPLQYISEKFVVPTDGSVTSNPSWAFSGSGLNTNWSLTVSTCPGDFGQTGTQITQAACKVNQGHSSSGMKAKVSATPVSGFCSVVPGQTYYFNILPSAYLPVNDIATSDCTSGTCKPWVGRN